MTTTDTRTPIWRRRWAQAAGAVLALALVGGAILAGSRTTVIRPAANAAPATPKVPPRPTETTRPPAPDRYVTDILNAGITATAAWINSTGHTLVRDWRVGYTAAWTDANVLAPAASTRTTTPPLTRSPHGTSA
jgi:hypothetical protein